MTCEKVLYAPFLDRRQNIQDFNGDNSDKIKEQARSVACFVSKTDLVKDKLSKKYTLAPHVKTLSGWIQYQYKSPLGGNEPFAQERVLGYATGFLGTDTTIVTAAHVVCKSGSNTLDQAKIEGSYVVFDYNREDAEFDKDQVFKVKRVISHSYSKMSDWQDWAFLKLNRKVTGRDPLPFNWSLLQSEMTTEFYMLGFPSGLRLKCTDGGTLMDNSHKSYVQCKIDACGGNSGSPVFRADTGEVVAILCEGNIDYIIDHNYNGQGLKRCVSNKIPTADVQKYEKCQRISQLESVKEYIERWSIGFKLHKISLPHDVNKPGFYVFGHCTSDACTVLKQSLWMARGNGTFHLEEVLHRSTCQACKTGSIEVTDFGIYASRYAIEGELIEPKKALFHEQNSVALKTIKTFKQVERFTWSYLKIQVTKL